MQSAKVKIFVVERTLIKLSSYHSNSKLDSNLNSSIRILGLLKGCIVEYQDIYKLSMQTVV